MADETLNASSRGRSVSDRALAVVMAKMFKLLCSWFEQAPANAERTPDAQQSLKDCLIEVDDDYTKSAWSFRQPMPLCISKVPPGGRCAEQFA